MKRILLLGGSTQQIPAIEYARKQGYYTIVCDYLEDNPGQYYANKFYCVSTTNKKIILEIAQKENVDGIVAYASDPAAPTAAFVAEKMQLPTNPYKSVKTLAYKDEFRKFLRKNSFNSPKADSYNEFSKASEDLINFKFPIMIKPVDSSGSKGVRKVDSRSEFEVAFKLAMIESRSKHVIIEEFIEKNHEYLIGGDCFVVDGKVEFWGLLNCHRDTEVNSLVPVGKSYPLKISEKNNKVIHNTIQKIVELLGIKFGGFNIELIFDKDENLYLIEMGPRNGGNMIPDLLKVITGVDLVAAAIETSIGCNNFNLSHKYNEGCYATYNLHSSANGVFKGIEIDKELEKKIVKKILYKKQGDNVEFFDGANKAIGILFLRFSSKDEMFMSINNFERYINIIVE